MKSVLAFFALAAVASACQPARIVAVPVGGGCQQQQTIVIQQPAPQREVGPTVFGRKGRVKLSDGVAFGRKGRPKVIGGR